MTEVASEGAVSVEAITPASQAQGPGGGTAEAPGTLERLSPLLVVVPLAMVPFLTGSFEVGLMTQVLILGLFIASLDLLVGYSGLDSLGHAAFFGIGAYAAALLGIHVTPFAPLHLAVGLLAGGAVALVAGVLLVRTRGVYFLILTLAFVQILSSLAVTWEGMTGGSDGLAGVPPPVLVPGGDGVPFGSSIYWYVLGAVVLGYVVLRCIVGSPFGRVMRGVKQNESRVRALGYPVRRYKLAAFCIAGAMAGYAGALWTSYQQYVSPADISFELAVLAFIILVIGGMGTLYGAFLGAFVVVVIRDGFGTTLQGHGPLLLGVVFVLTIYLLPKGLAGGVGGVVRRLQSHARRVVRPRARPEPPTAPEGP